MIKNNSNLFFYSFVIPSEANDAGVSHGEIIKEYLQRLNRDVPDVTEDTPLFLQGKPGTSTQPSCFTKQVIGQNPLTDVPKFIAKKLGLPNINSYSGHSFRRTAATLAAEGNVSADGMTVSFIIFQKCAAKITYIDSTISRGDCKQPFLVQLHTHTS